MYIPTKPLSMSVLAIFTINICQCTLYASADLIVTQKFFSQIQKLLCFASFLYFLVKLTKMMLFLVRKIVSSTAWVHHDLDISLLPVAQLELHIFWRDKQFFIIQTYFIDGKLHKNDRFGLYLPCMLLLHLQTPNHHMNHVYLH